MPNNTPVGMLGGLIICAVFAGPLLAATLTGFRKSDYVYGVCGLMWIFGAIMVVSLYLKNHVFAPCVGLYLVPFIVAGANHFFSAWRKKDKPVSLDDLLADTTREDYALTEEDREWMNAPAVGKEIIVDDYNSMPEAAAGEK